MLALYHREMPVAEKALDRYDETTPEHHARKRGRIRSTSMTYGTGVNGI